MSLLDCLNERLAETITTNNVGSVSTDATNNFSTQQISAEGLHDTQNTTGFSADANIVSASVNSLVRLDSLLVSSSADTSEQSLKEFFAKPALFASGVFSTTDTVSTFSRYTSPHDFIQKPMFLNKLSGFLGFRATIVLRLQVNANRFQQGRYMLCFTHSGGSNPTGAAGLLNYNAHTNTLIARTQLPHVELDLSCDTQAILKIPYTSCMNYTPVSAIVANNGYGAIGSVQIFPYSPLVAPTGSTTCNYALWVSFEDVELVTAAAPQSGRIFSKSISEKEADSQGKGPISSTMLKVAKASSLFIPVPGISSYASGLSWMAEIAGNAASVFGWSKPVNQSGVNKMERQALANFCHVNTVDQGQMLALNSKNAVDVLPGFSSTDTDEMDFSYLVTIPAWVRTFTWTTAQVSGTTLYEIGVHPNANVNSRALLGGVICNDFTPMQYVASFFNFWRGSIVYTFKIVKTEFHSGRIAIAFFPHDDNVSVSSRSLDLSSYVHREVVDIRECSTITVAIPFVSSSSYRPLRGTGWSIGSISIYVVDPLTAPASVSSTVSILMEISGGPDMEFAVPRSITEIPVMGATPQMGSLTDPVPGEQECTIVNTTIGNTIITSDGGKNAAACIGEKISSFRTLMKSMNILNYLVTRPSFSSKYYYTVLPFATNVYNNSLTNNYPTTTSDLYSSLSACYALVRGSVRIKFISNFTSNVGLAPVIFTSQVPSTSSAWSDMVSIYTTASNLPSGNNAAILDRLAGPQQFNNVSANFGAETCVPQYHRFHSRATADHYAGLFQSYAFGQGSLTNKTALTYYFPSSAPGAEIPLTYVARGAGDDCNFGVFVSVPPMMEALGASSTDI